MKFNVSSSDLLKKLQVAAGAIGSMNVLPILEDFLFTIQDNMLTITASDLETSIVTQIEVTGDGEANIAVPAKILLDTLKALPAQPITFNINEDILGEETYAVTATKDLKPSLRNIFMICYAGDENSDGILRYGDKIRIQAECG